MEQYTTPEQTAKLIELGFEKPKSIEVYRDGHCVPFVEQQWVYSIGELIEMLPKQFNVELLEIKAATLFYSKWVVRYPYAIIVYNNELIDALYAMILTLKKEGVI